jgi:carboxymethylenebutenolidase
MANGETVEFVSNGGTASGYLARSINGHGPGVIVLQEWWGLVPQIKRSCDRLGASGFSALAPDLFHGEIAEHDEMDKAGHLMSTLPPDRAARDMGSAIDFLLGHESVTGDAVGVIGFCMGGMLALVLAAQQGARVKAVAPFYGAPLGDNAPDWSGLTAVVRGHFAGDDGFFGADAVRGLEDELKHKGKDVEFTVYEGRGHAFANEENALGTYHKADAEKAWDRAVAFLHEQLG